MADTISIDMANVLSYLRKQRDDVKKRRRAADTELRKTYHDGRVAAYEDCINKTTQVLSSHAKSWAKFAHSLEQQVEHDSFET